MQNKRLVMIPGPTPTIRRIEDQMSRPTCAHGDPDFVKDFKEVVDKTGALLDCSGQTFVIAGSGSLAMEMAIANNLKSGDNLLIVSNGFFGDRFIDIAERKGINVDVIKAPWGKAVSVGDIENKLGEKTYAAVTVSHVDTSTAVLAPIAEIGEMVSEKYPDTIYIVDGVAATAGARSYVDGMHIDVLLTGSQKAFGVAPGLAILFASKKSLERRKTLGVIPEYYVDYEKWIPIMQDPAKYFATPPINLIWALQEAIKTIEEEGIEARYDRHEKQAAAMRKALEVLGFKVTAEAGCEAPTLTNCYYMDGINDSEFRNYALDEGVMLAGALGEYAGKAFRIGHMGNADVHDLVAALAGMERALVKSGVEIELGKSIGVFMKEME
ncbi:MAG: alanine--glyoxylate aminotransferase family protein [Clostridia bacterium]|nr:alanine--glyoxylate aminotransferase family protein [Clostridia bacterium]